MCRVASTELEGSVAAVAQARAFVAAALRRWDLADLVVDAELLTSELVTNAVLHARSKVTVTVAVAEGTTEIGVADRSLEAPEPRVPEDAAEGGRGLRLVDQVAQEWGVADLSAGKQVWFRLDVGPTWAHRTSCPCAGDELSRVRLDSGRYAVAQPGPWDEV